MSATKTGGPAFPVSIAKDEGHQDSPTTWQYPGLSMRDYFAAKALQAVVGSIMPHERHGWNSSDFAREAYELADAMIAERAK